MRRENSASASMDRGDMHPRDSCEALDLGAEAGVDRAEAAAPAAPEGPQPAAGGPPQHLCCPVSLELMQDPVVVATGITYDRDSIARWLDAGHRTCPSTGVRLRHLELVPNFALRSAIADWAEANGVALRARPLSEPHGGVPPHLLAPPPGHDTLPDAADDDDEPPPASHVLQGHDEIVWSVEVSPSTGRVYTASADGSVRCWDAHSRRCIAVLEGHTRPVLALALSDTHLWSGSYDTSVRAWCLRTLRRVAVLNGHTDAVRSLQVVGPAGGIFSASYDCTIRAWCTDSLQPKGGSARHVLRGHTGPVRALAAVGTRLFSASYDKTVRCWDALNLTCLGVLDGHREAVRALTPLPDHNLVASGSDDWTVRLWDATSLSCLAICEGHTDNVRVLAAAGDCLYSGSWDQTVRAWALGGGPGAAPAGTCLAVMAGHREAVLALTVARGHVVSGSFDASVRFWSTTTPGFPCVAKCDGHEDAVRVLASSGPQAATCYSGSYDGCIGFLRVPLPSHSLPAGGGASPQVLAVQHGEGVASAAVAAPNMSSSPTDRPGLPLPAPPADASLEDGDDALAEESFHDPENEEDEDGEASELAALLQSVASVSALAAMGVVPGDGQEGAL